MDFGLTETQEMIRASARDFLASRESVQLARKAHSDRDANRALWDEICSLGWPGLWIDERYGGSGMGFDDLAVLLEECASGLMPGPLFETTVLGTTLVAEYAGDQLKDELLPGISTGETVVTLAHLEAAGRWDTGVETRAESSQRGWTFSGRKRFVPAGALATHFVVTAKTDDDQLVMGVVPSDASGIEIEPMKLASGEAFASVRMNGVMANESAVICADSDGGRALRKVLARAAGVRALQMAAVADALVNRTVEYVSNRKQFGRPVGSFQALQHRLADMATTARSARHLGRSAAWHIANDLPYEATASQAKAYASAYLPDVCWAAHQCHGAIGFTWEHDLHLYTRRVVSWRAEYGDHHYWRSIGANRLLNA